MKKVKVIIVSTFALAILYYLIRFNISTEITDPTSAGFCIDGDSLICFSSFSGYKIKEVQISKKAPDTLGIKIFKISVVSLKRKTYKYYRKIFIPKGTNYLLFCNVKYELSDLRVCSDYH